MSKRRKRKQSNTAVQKVVVSLNPQYYQGLPDSLSLVLPTPENPTPNCSIPFIWQKQRDSGDCLVFFKTRWRDRDSLAVFTDHAGQSPTVFAVMPEESYEDRTDFMRKLGYDICWDRIIELDWDVFKRFVFQASASSIYNLLEQTSENEIDNPLHFTGSLLWLPKTLRDIVSSSGNFTSDWSGLLSIYETQKESHCE